MNNRTNTAILLLYVCFFLVLFVQFPLKGTIPGNCDNWFAIAYSNIYLNKIISFFTGAAVGTSLYPITDVYAYGESAPLTGLIFIFFKLFGFNDVVCNYLFLTTLFSWTAFSTYLLTHTYVNNWQASILAGFFFSCAGFTFGNMDTTQAVFFGIAFLSIYYARRFLLEKKTKYVIYAAVLGGLQVYFSAYVFLLQSIILGLLVLLNFRQLFWESLNRRNTLLAIVIFLAFITPFFGFYTLTMAQKSFYNPHPNTFIASVKSLSPNDLLRSLPNNLLYPYQAVLVEDIRMIGLQLSEKYGLAIKQNTHDWLMQGQHPELQEDFLFISIRTCANIGWLIYLLAFIGILKASPPLKKELLIIGVVGFFLSLGPVLLIGQSLYPAPFFLCYKYLPFFDLFRVPVRGFFVFLLMISIFASIGFVKFSQKLTAKQAWKTTIGIGLLFFFFVENIPVPFHGFTAQQYIKPPVIYNTLFDKPAQNTLLELPSNPGVSLGKGDESLFEYNREIIYMNWQTYHKQNIVNGSNGYYPQSRLKLQQMLETNDKRMDLVGLQREYAIDHIIFHKHMVVYEDEKKWLDQLRTSKLLTKVVENDTLVVFRVKN